MRHALLPLSVLMVLSLFEDDINKREIASDRERVYVIDTGIDFSGKLSKYRCRHGHKNVLRPHQNLKHWHGTAMAELIVQGHSPNKICLVDVKFYSKSLKEPQQVMSFIKALKHIENQPPGIVNLSVYGYEPSAAEKLVIYRLLRKGFKLSISAGNNGQNLTKKCDAFPACYFTGKNKRSSVRVSTTHKKHTNKYGPVTNMVYIDSDSSQAAAVTTRRWINE